MSTLNTIEDNATQVFLRVNQYPDNNIKLNAPDGFIPTSAAAEPHQAFPKYAESFSPVATITATGVQFANPA